MAGLVVVGLVLGHHTVRAEGVENNSADAAYKSDAVAETINTNVQKRTVLHQMVLKNLDESFDQLVDTLKQAVIKKESLQEARDAIPMPGLYEWLALLREYVSSFFMASAQEQAFNQ